MFDRIYRAGVLGVAGQKQIENLVRSRAWSVAQRFVAGEETTSALAAVRELAADGVLANLDLLGEFVSNIDTANAFAEQILSLQRQATEAGIKPYVSVKLSSIGQGQILGSEGQDGADLGPVDLGYVNARRIVRQARELGGFVCLDMEDHTRVDQTLQQFRELLGEFGAEHVGTVLQSYLYRSEADRDALDDLHPNLRVVKGAYLEPQSVAMPQKADVDASYRRLVYANLKAGNYTNVATHDPDIIDDVKMFVLGHGIPKDRFEFQMLYGIRRDLQKKLAAEGFTVRAYLPYGRDWYAYFSRRIAERPANVMFVLRGMLRG